MQDAFLELCEPRWTGLGPDPGPNQRPERMARVGSPDGPMALQGFPPRPRATNWAWHAKRRAGRAAARARVLDAFPPPPFLNGWVAYFFFFFFLLFFFSFFFPSYFFFFPLFL